MPTFSWSIEPIVLLSILARAIRQVVIVAGSSWLLIAPAAYLVDRFSKRHFSIIDRPLLAVLAVALFGYATFWCYFLHPTFGKIVSSAWIAAAVVCSKRLYSNRSIYAPLTIAVGVSVFYLGLLNFRGPTIPTLTLAYNVGGWGLPGDQVIPEMFADRIYDGEDPRDMGGTWRSSDRPPLQAGLFLILKPMFRIWGLDTPINHEPYHLVCVLIQSSWAIAALFLLGCFGLSMRTKIFSFLCCLFSYFFMMNTVFVWPKFSAGALVAIGIVFLFYRAAHWKNTAVGALLLVLAALSHGGVIFSLVILIPWWWLRLKREKVLQGAVLVATLIVTYSPWVLYQRLYDPPGNRLIKMHFAGVEFIDSRGTWQAIQESYAAASWDSILKSRWDNTFVTPFSRFIPLPKPNLPAISRWLRESEFFSLFPMLGFLSIGVFLIFLSRFTGHLENPEAGRWTGYLLISYLFWTVSFFNASSSILVMGSYFFHLIATLVLSSVLPGALGMPIACTFLAGRIVAFSLSVYVWPTEHGPWSLPFILMSLVGLGIIRRCFYSSPEEKNRGFIPSFSPVG